MEKVQDLAVIPADVGWSDLGSWHTVWELGKRDEHGNVASESAVLVDAQNNLWVVDRQDQGLLGGSAGVARLVAAVASAQPRPC